jgi:hypothetical protein
LTNPLFAAEDNPFLYFCNFTVLPRFVHYCIVQVLIHSYNAFAGTTTFTGWGGWRYGRKIFSQNGLVMNKLIARKQRFVTHTA